MKLASWNVNGLRGIHNKGMFVPAVKKINPDIMCLQETKAEKGQAVIDLPEYEEYWNSSTTKKGYAGTAIFTKIKPEKVILGFPPDILERYSLTDGFGDPNKEGRVITLELEKVFVVNVYTPNAKPDLSRLTLRHTQWDPAFLAYLKHLEKQKPVIFCGDLNVAHTEDDLTNPKANEGEHGFTKEEREGIDKLISAGFIDTFRIFTKGKGHYSWWSNFALSRERNVGWRIDYFFVSHTLKNKVKTATIETEFFGSDHCPVTLYIENLK